MVSRCIQLWCWCLDDVCHAVRLDGLHDRVGDGLTGGGARNLGRELTAEIDFRLDQQGRVVTVKPVVGLAGFVCRIQHPDTLAVISTARRFQYNGKARSEEHTSELQSRF